MLAVITKSDSTEIVMLHDFRPMLTVVSRRVAQKLSCCMTLMLAVVKMLKCIHKLSLPQQEREKRLHLLETPHVQKKLTETYLKILNQNFQSKQMQWATLTLKTVDSTQWAHTNSA